MEKIKIVIVGAGFGGVNVALGLKKLVKKGIIELTMISKNNAFLFTPLLHEVATGGLDPMSVTESLREIFAGTDVKILESNVERIDTARKVVISKDIEIAYDKLVVATGATTNTFGIPGVEDYTYTLKSLADAILIREKIIDAFELAALETDELKRKKLLSFVVVGGGPTGVELVTEIAEFVFAIECKYFNRGKADSTGLATVTLIHAGHELLAFLSVGLREVTRKRLSAMRINVRFNTIVSFVWENVLGFSDGTNIQTGLIIWTAGVKASMPEFTGIIPKYVNGRAVVNKDLSMKDVDDVFVIGDSAFVEDSTHQAYSMLAQVAEAEAKCLVNNIVAIINGLPTKSFDYKLKGYMVSLGQWYAVAELFGISLHGRFAWWLWRTVYLFKFTSFEKRLRIAFDWTINLFYSRDITKLS